MNFKEILVEEGKKEGLEAIETIAFKVYDLLKTKVLPRTALESESEKEKSIAAGALVVLGALDPLAMNLIDKINPEG